MVCGCPRLEVVLPSRFVLREGRQSTMRVVVRFGDIFVHTRTGEHAREVFHVIDVHLEKTLVTGGGVVPLVALG